MTQLITDDSCAIWRFIPYWKRKGCLYIILSLFLLYTKSMHENLIWMNISIKNSMFMFIIWWVTIHNLYRNDFVICDFHMIQLWAWNTHTHTHRRVINSVNLSGKISYLIYLYCKAYLLHLVCLYKHLCDNFVCQYILLCFALFCL